MGFAKCLSWLLCFVLGFWLEFALLVAGLLFDFLSVCFRVVSLGLDGLLFCWNVLVLSLVFVDCNVWGLFLGVWVVGCLCLFWFVWWILM